MGAEAHLITTFEGVRTFLADDERFPGGVIYRYSTRPSVGSTFIDLDGDEHHLVRRLATPAFRSRAVRRFIDDELTPLADEVLDRMFTSRSDDLARDFVRILPFWAISRKLGLPVGTEERQRSWALALLSHPTDPDGARRAAAEVTEFLLPTLAERRAAPRDDVVSRLLTTEVDGVRLTDEQVASHVRLLYAVGATTTSDGLGTLLRRALTEPGLWERGCAPIGRSSRPSSTSRCGSSRRSRCCPDWRPMAARWRASNCHPAHWCCAGSLQRTATRRCSLIPTDSTRTDPRPRC